MKKQYKTFLLWAVVFLMMALVMGSLTKEKAKGKTITFSEFIPLVKDGKVKSVKFQKPDVITGKFIEAYENGSDFKSRGDLDNVYHTETLAKAGLTFDYLEPKQQGLFMSILANSFPVLIILFVFYFFLRQIQAGGGKAMSFGKSKAKMLNESDKKVTFSDVSGVEEAKEELVEVVDFLKEPKKYTSLGGKIPKGVLLIGPPGTGKTLLARAVAGEAGVPFFSISGSDFVEMFVGVGASRVRDLFEQGKRHAPCIIFIDEIDAVGRHRGSGMGGGHDEREQTLNQLLVEMDGFESNEGVILIAATNRMDVLDQALLRPGRFDRRVNVGRPDVRGRLGILKVHTKKTPLGEKINLENIAKGTPGFTGADLANLVNEAALLAAREGKKKIENIDFENAKDKVLMGVERRSMVISDAEKRVTAYHEAGHTLVGLSLPHTDPIHKVTIIPRGGALGVTQTLPTEDRLNMTSERAENFIAFLMGGRCAEEIIFGEMTNGASNDIERATELAYNMVCNWGMSKSLGPLSFGKSQTNPFQDARGSQFENVASGETAIKIDKEIYDIVQKNYEKATQILSDKKDILIRLSEALIDWETLDSDQVNKIVAGEDIGLPKITDSNTDQTPPTTEVKKESEVKKKDTGYPSGGNIMPA